MVEKEGEEGLEKKKEKETEETQTSGQPASPHCLLPLCPVFVHKSDRGSAHSGSFHTTSHTNWDSDQRKSCSSAARSARQVTSIAEHGEGADGVIRRD